jgi:putative tryptophan/tyrosine transport system substrate-binding protein
VVRLFPNARLNRYDARVCLMGASMRRREFIGLFGGAAVCWPLATGAQQSGRPRLIAVVIATKEGDPDGEERLAAFEQTLADAGWKNGRDVRFEVRWLGGDPERIRSASEELTKLKPDVIFAGTTPAVAALHKIAGSIPIVFVLVSDPVGSGFVASLAHPGGSITGFLNFEASLVGKWLELLRLAAPSVRRVRALFNPQTSNATYYFETLRNAASAIGVPVVTGQVNNDVDIEVAINDLRGDGGLIVMPDGFTTVHRHVIIAKSAQFRVPAIYPYRAMAAKDGGLIAYGVDAIDFYRRAASYVDRILRGEMAANLPVQAPTKYDLVINLKTAKSIGLNISPTLLATADEVIE